MASGQIKLDSAAFSTTWATQRQALATLQACCTRQQSALSALSGVWKGAGGDAFRGCAKELSTESLTGLFMVTIISNQIMRAQNTMEATDASLASRINLTKK